MDTQRDLTRAPAPGPRPEEIVARLAGRGRAAGRYRIQGEVDRGGMGAILRVWDEDLRRHLAMKVILERGEGTATGGATTPAAEKQLARFLEEAQVTGQLDHPGIVPVHELGLDEAGRVYFTMKLVKGTTLREVLDDLRDGTPGWSATRVLGVLLKVCEAMAYAHDKGVIHRDLKPGNVMVGKYGEVYVMDWGLARVLGAEDAKDVRIRPVAALMTSELRSERADARGDTPDSPLYTMDGDIVGTPAYMPPEQAAGDLARLGPRSDVYAVGAMLYHLLAGHMPYVPRSARLNNYAVWVAVQQGPPRPVHEMAREAPAELCAICEKAMAREPEQRYPDMGALAADLAAFLEGRVVGAYETGAWAEARKWVRRNRGMALSLLAGLAALVAGLTASLVLKARADENAVLAQGHAERASAASEKVWRLSAFQTLADLEGEADLLWPVAPELEARYVDWLERARRLIASVPELRGSIGLEGAGGAVGPGTVEDGEQAEEERRWWRGQMEKLVAQIEAFGDPATGLVAGVSPEHGWGIERRLELARTIGQQSAHGPDAAQRWSQALAAIGTIDAYRGCEWPGGALRPQMGLLPLGPDADSRLWEFAHLPSGEPAQRGADGKLVLTEETGIVLVLIPGGTQAVGAQSTDPGGPNHDPAGQTDEQPVNEVELAPYLIAKHEMTQAQWRRLCGRNPSAYGPDGQWSPGLSRARLAATRLSPVENISWNDCAALLPRYGLRLPTEAQWEHAARGGTTTPWSTGDEPGTLDGSANLGDAFGGRYGSGAWSAFEPAIDDGFAVHAPVGTFAPNPFGLHDVHGNVWEWCQDGFGSYTLPCRAGDGERLVADPQTRVDRGGSWIGVPSVLRSAMRFWLDPGARSGDIGVRPAAALR